MDTPEIENAGRISRRPGRRPRAPWAIAVVGAVAAMAPAAASAEILGHRAVYTLSLNRIVGDSNVADARGVFAVEWTDRCDGWAVEQSYSLHVAYHEQPDQLISSRYTTWEAKDGLSFTFDVVTNRSGRRAERVQGTAELDPETHAGTAEYVEPRGLEIALPAGAMFPAAHTEAMLSRAETGERLWPAVVFDGANVDQPLLINAAFGRAVEAPSDSEAQLAAVGPTDLTTVPGWQVRMAVFPETGSGEEPDYEIQMDLLTNGVARSMRLDYGDFILDAELRVIEPTGTPEC